MTIISIINNVQTIIDDAQPTIENEKPSTKHTVYDLAPPSLTYTQI